MAAAGTWNVSINTQMGVQKGTLTLSEEGGELSGSLSGPLGTFDFSGGKVEGNELSWGMTIKAMGQEIKMDCSAAVDGDSISGAMKTPMGSSDFTGERAS